MELPPDAIVSLTLNNIANQRVPELMPPDYTITLGSRIAVFAFSEDKRSDSIDSQHYFQ